MIQISPRKGSKELSDLFGCFDIPVDLSADMPFSDFAFIGNGPNDSIIRVGIERKAIGDFLDSIRSRRLSGHQLNGLCEEFDYVIVVVEGQWKAGQAGELLAYKNGHWIPMSDGNRIALYRSVQNYSMTLRMCAGTKSGNPIITERTLEPFETVSAVVSWYHWFNDKQWEQHRAHEGPYVKDYRGPENNSHKPYLRRQVSQLETMLSTLEGLDATAHSVAVHFGSIDNLCHASIEDLSETPIEQWLKSGGKRTIRLGEKKAEKIWKGLRSR